MVKWNWRKSRIIFLRENERLVSEYTFVEQKYKTKAVYAAWPF